MFTPGDVLSLMGAIAIIIIMLVGVYYASRWYARRMGGSFGMGKYIKVIDRAQMGAAAIAIVEIDSRYYLIGLSERNVQLLCELPDFSPDERTAAKGNFGQIFGDFLEKARRGKTDKDDEGKL